MPPRSHAIEHPQRPATVAERVAYIADMMRDLRWKRGKTAYELAKVWGVSPSTIENYSAEANRKVCAEVTDPEYVSRTVCSALEEVIESAREEMVHGAVIEKVGDNGEPIKYTLDPNIARRSITQAAKTWAEISGAMAPTKLRVGEDPPSKLTDEELAKLLPEALRVARERGIDTSMPDEPSEENEP